MRNSFAENSRSVKPGACFGALRPKVQNQNQKIKGDGQESPSHTIADSSGGGNGGRGLAFIQDSRFKRAGMAQDFASP